MTNPKHYIKNLYQDYLLHAQYPEYLKLQAQQPQLPKDKDFTNRFLNLLPELRYHPAIVNATDETLNQMKFDLVTAAGKNNVGAVQGILKLTGPYASKAPTPEDEKILRNILEGEAKNAPLNAEAIFKTANEANEKGATIFLATYKAAKNTSLDPKIFLATFKAAVENGRRNEKIFAAAFKAAAKNGHTEVVRLLLPYSTKHLDKGILAAAKNAHVEVVRLLLPYVDKDIRGKALKIAAENGRTEVVQLFLSPRVKDVYKPPLWSYNHGIKGAAQNGHTKVVQLLLPDANDDGRRDALKIAAENGRAEVVQLFLSPPVTKLYGIPPTWTRNQGLKGAAENCHAKVVRLLLPYVDKDIREDALHIAAENGHAKVVQLFFDSLTKKEDFYLQVIKGLKEAARKNSLRLEEDTHQAVIEYLPDAFIEPIFNEVINAGTTKIVTQDGNIIIEGIGLLKLGKLLLPRVKDSELLASCLKDAITNYIKYKNKEAYYEQRKLKLSYNAFFDMIKCLSLKIEDSSSRGECLQLAAEEGYRDVVTLLLKDGDVTQEGLDLSFQAAAKNGCLEVVKHLLENKKITSSSLKESLAAIRKNGHEGGYVGEYTEVKKLIKEELKKRKAANIQSFKNKIAQFFLKQIQILLKKTEAGSVYPSPLQGPVTLN